MLITDIIFMPQEFEDSRDAEEAVREMNGRELCGDRFAL